MKLDDFLNSRRGVAASIAREIGVRPVVVSRWKSGAKPIPVKRCLAIERATSGAVRRWDLRPDDWASIWPELIGTEGAPRCGWRKAA